MCAGIRFVLTSAIAASVLFGGDARFPAIPAFFYETDGGGSRVIAGKAAGLSASFGPAAVDLYASGTRLRIRYLDADTSASIDTVEPLPGTLNLLLGDQRIGVRTYGAVRYRALYPGTDMVFGASGRLLKSEFRVAPGADPGRIRFRYEGAGRTTLTPDGSLEVESTLGVLREDPPQVYQDIGGERRNIPSEYVVSEDGTVSFHIGSYDQSAVLVIDPTISFGTYLGGNGVDVVTGMALDTAGNAYLTGYSDSPDFPVAGALQARGGSVDAFVVKISAAGDKFLYATYIGGVGDDRAMGIAVDATGRAAVVGYTSSANFPTLHAVQGSSAGGRDAFVLMLNASGSTLAFSTFLGGGSTDEANAVAVDNASNVYVAGDTSSTNFRVSNAYKSTSGGRQDAFVAKFNSAGALLFSTYLGGAGDDKANGIAIDTTGAIYVAGETSSPNFPVLNAFQAGNGGGQDAFVAKLNATGSTLVYSSYLGGAGGSAGQPESASGIAVDAAGNAYVAGVTSSANFPLVAAWQSTFGGGGTDAFVAKVNTTGKALVFSTYLGGIGGDAAKAIAVESSGNILVVGSTFSVNFPTLNAIQQSKKAGTDAFLTRFTPGANDLFLSTYLGGAGADAANAVRISAAGDVWIAGQTTSPDLPLTNPLQSFGTPEGNGFAMKLGIQNLPPAFSSLTPANGSGMQQTFQFVGTDPNGGADIKQITVVINSTFASANSCYFFYDMATGSIALSSDDNSAWSIVGFGSSATISNSACSITGTGSSIYTSGNNFVFTVVITFKPGFGGGKGIWASVDDKGGLSSGWAQRGSWGVFPGALTAPTVSSTPAFGSGTSQVFQFTGSDANGYGDLKQLKMVINSVLDLRNSCYIKYDEGLNVINLASNDSLTWMPVTIGSSGSVSNTQCTINGTGSSVTRSGTSITVTVSISFNTANFQGGKHIWMLATDQENLNSNWQPTADWGIFTGAAVAPTVSLTPPTGTGNRQIYQFTVTDLNSASDIKQMNLLMNGAFSFTNGCYFNFIPGSSMIYLASDDTKTWLPVQLGTAQSASNSQCTLTGTGGSAITAGNSITLTLPLSFSTTKFGGPRTVWAYAMDQEALASGWKSLATFTVQ